MLAMDVMADVETNGAARVPLLPPFSSFNIYTMLLFASFFFMFQMYVLRVSDVSKRTLQVFHAVVALNQFQCYIILLGMFP